MNDIEQVGRDARADEPLGSFREALNALSDLAWFRSYSTECASREDDDPYLQTNRVGDDTLAAFNSRDRYEAWREANHMDVSDVPSRDGQTSSIGSLGRPTAASAERLKGGYQEVVRDARSLEEALGEFLGGIHQLDGTRYTRVQYRMITETLLLRQYSHALHNIVEAIVPLDPGNLGEQPVFVYLAHNDQARERNVIDSRRMSQNIQSALSENPRSVSELLQVRDREYVVDVLTEDERRSGTVLDQVALLYARFGWRKEDVREMLTNPANIFAAARHASRIVSCGIAELATVPIGDTQFRIAELTEAATLHGHERRGFYTAISTNILLELRRRSQAHDIFGGELDLVFGEGNGLSEGVLRVGRHQGRTLSTEVAAQYGFNGSGILHQQVRIEGPINSHTRYNDLVVMSLTRSDLYGLT